MDHPRLVAAPPSDEAPDDDLPTQRERELTHSRAPLNATLKRVLGSGRRVTLLRPSVDQQLRAVLPQKRGGTPVAPRKRRLLVRLSIYIPESKATLHPVQRLMALAEKKDCTVNNLVVEAILEYLDLHGV